MTRELPRIFIGKHEFYVDEVLLQIRKVNNPHEYYDFYSLSDMFWSINQLQRVERDHEIFRARWDRRLRILGWAFVWAFIFVGLAYLFGKIALGLGAD